MTDKEKIKELLDRGVKNIYPKREFLEKLLNSDKKLKLYLGIDPTGPTLHLGHAIVLNKLKQFQDLGHQIILLIGSFTAMIGDPTDKKAARKQMTREQVMENCKNYKEQASKILDFEGKNPVKIKFNHEWLDELKLRELIGLSSHFTVQRLLERDMFEKRFYGQIHCSNCGNDVAKKPNISYCPSCGDKFNDTNSGTLLELEINQEPIYLHEFLYPIMQGYDSVVMEVDGEVGGNDQTFNMLAGRDLMKDLKNKEKFVLTTKLLTDNTGIKMGKSEGNMLTLEDSAQDMYGKVMSWTDGMIGNGFDLCTQISTSEVEKIKEKLYNKDSKVNPKDYKMKLAYEIVKLYYSEKEAKQAQDEFTNVFKNKENPEDMKEYRVEEGKKKLIDIIFEAKLTSSKGEARRLIEQGAVKIDGKAENKWNIEIEIKEGMVVQVGKRKFIKLAK